MATTQVETVSTSADKAKLAAAVVLVVGAHRRRSTCSRKPGRSRAVGRAAGRPGCRRRRVREFASPVAQFVAFGRDSWREVKKVVWPTRKEAIQMTAYVFGFVVIMALFLWLTDKTLEWVFFDLILGWRK